MISLSADTGFPGPRWTFVRLHRGEVRFASVVRFLPRRLPAPVTKPSTGMTICVPLLLAIRSADGRRVLYRACQRPPSLLPLIGALCPLLGRPRFCAHYHRFLAVTALPPAVTKLIRPKDGAALTVPPLLAWPPDPHAHFYNVQVWALPPSGRPVKVLSIWPTANRLQLTGSWVFQGSQHRLAKGWYRWYVWPWIGLIARPRYGALIASSTFVVVS
jgi:hypothetical protein